MFSIRRYKEDKHDLKVFEKVVTQLNYSLRHFIDCLNDEFDIFLRPPDSHGYPMKLMLMLENIEALVSVYVSNRYASPAQVFNIGNELDKCKQSVVDLSNLVLQSAEHFQKQSTDGIDDADVVKFREKTALRVVYCLTILTTALNAILFTIQHDLIRILVGVDMRRELNNQRRTKIPKKDVKYTITVTKSKVNNDTKIRKEVNQNE